MHSLPPKDYDHVVLYKSYHYSLQIKACFISDINNFTTGNIVFQQNSLNLKQLKIEGRMQPQISTVILSLVWGNRRSASDLPPLPSPHPEPSPSNGELGAIVIIMGSEILDGHEMKPIHRSDTLAVRYLK